MSARDKKSHSVPNQETSPTKPQTLNLRVFFGGLLLVASLWAVSQPVHEPVQHWGCSVLG